MQIKISGICRGSGKVYTRFDVKDLDREESLSVQGPIISDTRIPCAIYEINESKVISTENSARQFVGAFPIVKLNHCTYTIQATKQNIPTGEAYNYQLNYEIAKWKSRLNYRLNKQLCDEIRDYDEVASYDKADMHFWSCIEDGEEMILRGALYTPYREDTELTITCRNDSLEEIPLSVIPFGTARLKPDFTNRRERREFQFSVRLPHQIRRFIFFIEDNRHPSFDNYTVLDDAILKGMLESNRKLTLNAQVDPLYQEWFSRNKATPGKLAKQREILFPVMPLFSIVVPLYNTPKHYFNDMVASVQNQTYATWELILVNASPDNQSLADCINKVCVADNRIKKITLDSNRGISENTNEGIRVATGDFISFFDHDDILEPNLLFSYAEAINTQKNIDVLYCDEDKLMPTGAFAQPFFKPDFDLELLRNNNYICHLFTIRSSLLQTLEPNTKEFDGAQDHNLALQAVEKARNIYHIPHVLYHWRVSETSTAGAADSKPYATQAGIKAVQNHLKRMGIAAHASQSRRPFTYKVIYDVPKDHPLISIIIPTKDQIHVLDTCLKSIIEKTTYDNYEIILIENNSTEQETFSYYESVKAKYKDRVSICYWSAEFNFSKLMNFGVEHSNGDYLLLLNNDTEVITPNWLEILLGICARTDVGVVGARLYFPDNTIQHAGLGISGGVATLLGHDLPRGNWGYFALLDAQRELSAVTAACLMTKRSTFYAVDGFTESLAVAFNDVDYCLKVRELKQKVIYTPEVELYHYESISRGAETSSAKKIRFHKEGAQMNYWWAKYYVDGDPYMNNNFNPLSWYYQLS